MQVHNKRESGLPKNRLGVLLICMSCMACDGIRRFHPKSQCKTWALNLIKGHGKADDIPQLFLVINYWNDSKICWFPFLKWKTTSDQLSIWTQNTDVQLSTPLGIVWKYALLKSCYNHRRVHKTISTSLFWDWSLQNNDFSSFIQL